MNREDFKILYTGLIYFDNAATALKPYILSETISDYYNYYSANAHRGNYDLSLKSSKMYEKTRLLVKEFINAQKEKEIIFTSGTTDSINKIVFGYFKHHLKKDDEVLLSKSEHASNVLPWFMLSKEIGFKIKYIPLNENHEITLESLKKMLNNKTKVIALAHITNVVGDIRPLAEIIEIAHKNNILVLVDGAQSVAHMPVDVQKLDIDFLAFSAHKMSGPTGVGVLYGKENLLKETTPIILGGGMSAEFNTKGEVIYKDLPDLLEAGTPNIAGVIGFGETIKYLNNIGMDKIRIYEQELKQYLIKRLKEIKKVKIYNEKANSSIVTINYEGISPYDLALYLNKYNICVRAGNHCAKILKEELNINNTCRISLYFYNTKKEVDYLIEILKNIEVFDF